MKLIISLILLLILAYIYLSNKEHFSSKKNVYIINESDKDKKALIYNVTKFTNLPNQLGNAIKLNGVDSYMVIPKIKLPIYSISLIFKQTYPSSNQILMSSASGGFIVQLENKYLTFSIYTEGNSLKKAYKYMINPSEWYHLVFVNEGTLIKVYVNGNLIEAPISTNNVLKELIIGTDTSKRFFFNGFVGKVQVLNKSLSVTEICTMHQLCKIINEQKIIEKKEKKRKKKCRFIPAGDTKAKCSEICMTKKNCNEVVCKNLCNNCDDEEYCAWLKKPIEDKSCKFIPYGPSKVACITNCNKEKNCDYLNCQKICLNCQDKDMCKWIIPPKPKKEEKEAIEPPPKYDPEGKPLAPVITIKPYNNKVKITWERPYNGDAPIEAYVCFLFKTFKMNEGIKVNMVPFPKCQECVHIVDELDSKETYSVGIRAYNNLGLSRMSNIETFIPKYNFKSARNIVKPIKLPEFTEYNFCNK